MRIGFDAKRYYHNRTGLGNYCRTIVKGLLDFYPDDGYLLYNEESWSRAFHLGRIALADSCHLLHGLSNELPLNITESTNGGEMRSLVTMHDVAWRTYPHMYHWVDRQIYDFKYGRSARNADHVIAISESTKRDVMRFYGVPEERISVIYQPVQQAFYSPISAEERKQVIAGCEQLEGLPEQFILNVGSINSRKNLLGLVQAMEMIKPENRPFLLVIGDGREYKKEVLSYLAAHQMEKYVRIETNIHDARVLQALYGQCSCMAYPSHYEGFGLPVVEAALQQAPVLTSTVSSLPEAAGPGAVLVNPSSTEEIFAALQRILEHPDEARQLGQKAEEYARRSFDPQALTRQMHCLYESLVKGDI